MSHCTAVSRSYIRVKYRPAMYHSGGEPIAVKRKPRNLGRAFLAYVSDDIAALWHYTEHRLLFGEVVL